MNSANFHEYLKNPSMLHQVSYQELKTLTLQYPYSANLRYLLLIKSLFDQNKDLDRNLALASLNSFDRGKLKQLVEQYNPPQGVEESFSLEEDFLELKDLSTLEEMPAESTVPLAGLAAEPPSSFEASILAEDEGIGEPAISKEEDLGFLDHLMTDEAEVAGESAVNEELEIQDEKEEPVAELEALSEAVEAEEEEEETIEEDFSIEELFAAPADEEEEAIVGAEKSDEAATLDEVPKTLEEIPLEVTDDTPEEAPSIEDLDVAPSPAAGSWLNRVKPAKKGFVIDDLDELPPAEKKPKKKPARPVPEDNAKEVASKSILEDSNIATETLAGLLERQGHNDKAIAMYERLQLKFPEKSSFFAGKIEALKKIK